MSASVSSVSVGRKPRVEFVSVSVSSVRVANLWPVLLYHFGHSFRYFAIA